MNTLEITSRQKDILLLLYKYRFLSRTLLQKFLNHKDYKTINMWLRDLVGKDLVGCIKDETFQGRNKPYIYYLRPKSKKILLALPNIPPETLDRTYQEHRRSESFVQHQMTIASLYFYFNEKVTDKGSYEFYTQTDLMSNEEWEEVKLDARILIKEPEEVQHFLLTLFKDKTPRYSIKAQVKRMAALHDELSWGEESPMILMLCPTTSMNKFVKWCVPRIKEELDNEEVMFFVGVLGSFEEKIEWVRV